MSQEIQIFNLDFSKLLQRYPELKACEQDIINAINLIAHSFKNNGKLITFGNGGSSSDAEHMCGELLKGFISTRSITGKEKEALDSVNPMLAANLQGSLPAISLGVQHSTLSAFGNDKSPEFSYAQQIWGLAKENDIVFGISTSGNSKNIIYGLEVARAKSVKTISLTGMKDSLCSERSDICIKAPAVITHMVQELHLPIYHAICLELENLFF